mmetsp:Transcript_1901/g.2660  ORF Transcript_1901/g.2660 Transcript_1901/m.2660 type:complete len:261 (-) Transcript_1901:113-895(-)
MRKGNLNPLGGRNAVYSGSLLLHAPAFGSSVLAFLNNLWYRPDGSGLSHVESTHGLLICGKLISVENSSSAYKTRVSKLFQPILADFGALSTQNTLLRGTGGFDGLELFDLTGFVIGGGGEAQSFPYTGHLGRSQVGFSNERKIDSESWQAKQRTNFVGFLFGTVHLVSKTVLVQSLFKTNFGNGFNTFPGIVETKFGSFEQTKVFHFQRRANGAATVLLRRRRLHRLLAQTSESASVDRVGRDCAGKSKCDNNRRKLHG